MGYYLLSVVLALGVFVVFMPYVMQVLVCFLVMALAGTLDALLWTLLANLTNALVGVFCERLVSRDCV